MSFMSDELQSFLQGHEQLKNCSCGYSSLEAESIAPFLITLSGWILIYGQPHFYETQVDIREFTNGKDLDRLVKLLIESFEMAASKESIKH